MPTITLTYLAFFGSRFGRRPFMWFHSNSLWPWLWRSPHGAAFRFSSHWITPFANDRYKPIAPKTPIASATFQRMSFFDAKKTWATVFALLFSLLTPELKRTGVGAMGKRKPWYGVVFK